MFKHFSAIVFLALFSFAYSQVSPGQCNDKDRKNVKAVKSFQAKKFADNGAPYYAIMANSPIFDCRVERYFATSSKNLLTVYEHKNLTTGVKVRGQGVVKVSHGSQLQGIELDYPKEPKRSVFKVIGVKYGEFAILYQCSNIDKAHRREFLYVLSRENYLSSKLVLEASDILDANGIDKDFPLPGIQQDLQACA